MTIAASNNVTQLLTQLVEEGTIRAEHRRALLDKHQELRTALQKKYKGKIWHATSQERQAILCGQVAIGLSKKLKYGLTPEVLSQALCRQQLLRITAAKKDVAAALDGDAPRFEFWVANLHQSMYDKPTHDDRMAAIGDLARELAVLAAHNPKIQKTTLAHLDALQEVLESIHFRDAEPGIKRQLHKVLDDVMKLAEDGQIGTIEVYDERNNRKTMTKDDLVQFINDTRFMVTE